MTSAELRVLQAPLKESYKANPSLAMIMLKAQGVVDDNVCCKVESHHRIIEAGLHPATGGDGSLACSGDLLLQALVACAGVTLSAVATAIGIEISKGKISAEGDLDFRGTLGVSKEVPVGFKSIRLYVQFESNAAKEKVENLIKLTERYCVVYQTLSKGVLVETVWQQ